MEVEGEVGQQRSVGCGCVLMMFAVRIVFVRPVVSHFVTVVVSVARVASPNVGMLNPRRNDTPCQHQG